MRQCKSWWDIAGLDVTVQVINFRIWRKCLKRIEGALSCKIIFLLKDGSFYLNQFCAFSCSYPETLHLLHSAIPKHYTASTLLPRNITPPPLWYPETLHRLHSDIQKHYTASILLSRNITPPPLCYPETLHRLHSAIPKHYTASTLLWSRRRWEQELCRSPYFG